MADARKYRDRIYIVKDIIITLYNMDNSIRQPCFSFCGLNISKHKGILDNLEQNEMIRREEVEENNYDF